jgi:hypothetical protein
MIILPRQARDKHSKTLNKDIHFLAAINAQVLLKNENRTLPLLIPLPSGSLRRRREKLRLALLGPHLNATTAMLSNYATSVNKCLLRGISLLAVRSLCFVLNC